MTKAGYSDRIDHALAFAGKHHYQQVWKGSRPPYGTSAANVGVILTRYDRDEDTVVAGILYGVVEDYVREGYSPDMLQRRVSEKFGDSVLDTLLEIVPRRGDDEGVELSTEERREDVLHRVAAAGERARWVLAAEAVHTGGSLIADLRRSDFPGAVWSRYAAGKEGTIRWYSRLSKALESAGFRGEILEELKQVAAVLEEQGKRTQGM